MEPTACFTVDVEPDCPPYLTTCRGVEEGLPAILHVLEDEGVRSTCFVTGEVARRFPEAVREVVARGHELGCHGMTHRRFSAMDATEARAEILESAAVLREFAPVVSFRAPNLDFPEGYLPLLAEAGFTLDSSRARYKPRFDAAPSPAPLARISASVTSAVLRLPRPLRNPWLRSLSAPVVLFTHPWEVVDLRRAPIPLQCRLGTGPAALRRLRSTLRHFRSRGFRFLTMSELAHPSREAA